MKEEIKDLIQEIVKHTRLNVKELQEGLALEDAARSISILVSAYLEIEKKEKTISDVSMKQLIEYLEDHAEDICNQENDFGELKGIYAELCNKE